MLIDSHAHISDTKFNEDRQVIIDKAFNSGLKYIIEVGCEPQFWDKVVELSKQVCLGFIHRMQTNLMMNFYQN